MSFKKITRERVVNDVPNVFAKDRDMHLRVNIKSYILYFWHMYKPYQTKSEMKTNKKNISITLTHTQMLCLSKWLNWIIKSQKQRHWLIT